MSELDEHQGAIVILDVDQMINVQQNINQIMYFAKQSGTIMINTKQAPMKFIPLSRIKMNQRKDRNKANAKIPSKLALRYIFQTQKRKPKGYLLEYNIYLHRPLDCD